jgi:chromosome segregation ATPase
MSNDSEGHFVAYTDYEALDRRVKELEAEAELEVEKANRIADVGVLRMKLAKAEAEVVRLREGWKQCNQERNGHFDQSCTNLRRAEAAEAELSTLRADNETLLTHATNMAKTLGKERDDNLRLRAKNERLRAGIKAVEGLINDSQGVYGLHLNGDCAPWDSLRTGGQFEDWLIDFDKALGGGA